MAASKQLRDQLNDLIQAVSREAVHWPGFTETLEQIRNSDALLQSVEPPNPRPRRSIRDLKPKRDDG